MCSSGCRPMSSPVGNDMPGSRVVENVRVAVEVSPSYLVIGICGRNIGFLIGVR